MWQLQKIMNQPLKMKIHHNNHKALCGEFSLLTNYTINFAATVLESFIAKVYSEILISPSPTDNFSKSTQLFSLEKTQI